MTDFHCRAEDRQKLGAIVNDLRNKGKTFAEIGALLGCTKERVRQIIKFGPGVRGRAPAIPKQEHDKIWQQFKRGIPVLQLAKAYETSYSVIRRIVMDRLAALPEPMTVKDYQKALRQDSSVAT